MTTCDGMCEFCVNERCVNERCVKAAPSTDGVRFPTVICPECGAMLCDTPARNVALCGCGHRWEKRPTT